MNAETSQTQRNLQNKLAFVAAIVVVSTAIGISVSWRVPGLELNVRDWLMRTRGNLPPSDELKIVAIDEASIARFGRFPWPRDLMAQALRKISTAQPKAIALDVLYADPSNESDDKALAEAISSAGKVIVAAQLTQPTTDSVETETFWLRPLPIIEQAAAGIGHVNIVTGFDGVARALLLRQTDDEANPLWAMAVEVIRLGEGVSPDAIREMPDGIKLGERTVPIHDGTPESAITSQSPNSRLTTFRVSQMWLDFAGPAGSFAAQTISFGDVMDGRVAPEKLRGQYVLIGATAAALGDRVASPFARANERQAELMPGVEILANAMNTILHNRFYRESPDWVSVLLAALVAVTTVLAFSLAQGRFEAAKHLLALATLAGLILLGSYLAFTRLLVFPPVAPMLISFLVAAPLALLQRSLSVSANIDRRIAELSEAGAALMPAHTSSPIAENGSSSRRWQFPRGGEWKANQLGSIAGQVVERARFVEQSLLSVEDGLVVTDMSGRITFANRRASEILRRQPHGLGALAGSDWFELLAEAEGRQKTDRQDILRRLLIDRVPLEREIEIGDSPPRQYMLRMAAVLGQDGREALGMVASLSDITKQRELQQARNDVMALVTHELKTPLTAIQAMSEVLAKYSVDANRSREMHLAINEEAKRLAAMIDEYLNITRLETGAQSLRPTSVRPAQLIERALLMLDPLAAQREIRILRRIAPNLPALVADADLISRAITNLVSNAIKFSPEKSEVILTAAAEDGELRIEVADSGCGIPAESLPRVFEKFYRVPRPPETDADVPGNGLGLALVREIAERHGGRVTVESELGVGSVFRLRLPLH